MTEPVPRSLHEHDFQHLQRQIDGLDRFLNEKIDALDREITANICSVDRRHTELAAERNKAVDAALVAAKEKAAAHNDILVAMKDQQALFYTKEQAAELDKKFEALCAEHSKKIEALEKLQIADVSKDKTIGMSASLIMQLLLAATLIISIVVFFANR